MEGKIEEIINRIKELYNLKTDGEVAKLLEMKHPALVMHKRRGTIPLKVLKYFCERENIKLTWLITGHGEKIRGTIILASPDGKEKGGKIRYDSSQILKLNMLFRGMREYRRINQEDIALHTGITKQAISGFEKEEITLSIRTLEKIAVFLGFKKEIVKKFIIEDIGTIADLLNNGVYNLYCDEEDTYIIKLLYFMGFKNIWAGGSKINDVLSRGLMGSKLCIFFNNTTIFVVHRKSREIFHYFNDKIRGMMIKEKDNKWEMEEKNIEMKHLYPFQNKKYTELISLLTS